MNYARMIGCVAIGLGVLAMAGCQFDHGSSYVAWNLPAAPPRLGSTAVAIQTSGYVSPAVGYQRVHDEVAGALAKVPGTTDAALPATLRQQRLNDGDLVAAAKKAGAKTLCVVTVNFLGAYVGIGIGIPPYRAASHVNYDLRLFDVATGTLLIHAAQDDQTFNLFEPPSNALADLRRGMDGMLRRSGLLQVTPKDGATTQPGVLVAVGAARADPIR